MWRRKIILKRVNLKITSLAQFHNCKFFKNWNQNYILRTFERNSTFECTLPRPFWVTKHFCELKIVKFNRFLCRVTWILQIRPFSTGFQPVFKKPVDGRNRESQSYDFCDSDFDSDLWLSNRNERDSWLWLLTLRDFFRDFLTTVSKSRYFLNWSPIQF